MIPKNSIAIKSTPGGEYVELRTNTPYKGYYYEYKNKLYAGKEFVVSGSIELVGINDTNKLLNNSSTSIYSSITGFTSQLLQTPPITTLASQSGRHRDNSVTHFYCKKYNDSIIKEIDENTYLNLKNNSLYITTYTGPYNNITQTHSEAIAQMPELDGFLVGIDSTPGNI
jgi:hypothetical protein